MKISVFPHPKNHVVKWEEFRLHDGWFEYEFRFVNLPEEFMDAHPHFDGSSITPNQEQAFWVHRDQVTGAVIDKAFAFETRGWKCRPHDVALLLYYLAEGHMPPPKDEQAVWIPPA